MQLILAFELIDFVFFVFPHQNVYISVEIFYLLYKLMWFR